MNRMIEVKYEDDVLKPITPIEGLKKNEKIWIIICSETGKESLHELVGTLTHEEAEKMRKIIDDEFERIENEW